MVGYLVYGIWILFGAAIAFWWVRVVIARERRKMQQELDRVRKEYCNKYLSARTHIHIQPDLPYQPNTPGPKPHACKPARPVLHTEDDAYPPSAYGLGAADATRCNQETGGPR